MREDYQSHSFPLATQGFREHHKHAKAEVQEVILEVLESRFLNGALV